MAIIKIHDEKDVMLVIDDKKNNNAAVVEGIGCGIDGSCPTSVTQSLDSSIRLDQYQAGSLSLSRHHRRRQQRHRHRRSSISSISEEKEEQDHVVENFEWYDLESIRPSVVHKYYAEKAMIIGHDRNAGLIFTTETQFYRKKAYVNRRSWSSNTSSDDESRRKQEDNRDESCKSFMDDDFVESGNGSSSNNRARADSGCTIISSSSSSSSSSSYSENNSNNNNGGIDLFFGWISSNNEENTKNESQREKEERLFREKIEQIESEMACSSSTPTRSAKDDKSSIKNINEELTVLTSSYYSQDGNRSNLFVPEGTMTLSFRDKGCGNEIGCNYYVDDDDDDDETVNNDFNIFKSWKTVSC